MTRRSRSTPSLTGSSAFGEIDPQIAFHPRNHRHTESALLCIPKAGIDERTVDKPQPVLLPREGMLALIVVTQQLRLSATAGIDVNVLGQTEAQVEEAQQSMSLRVVLAALARCLAPIVDALLLVGAVDRAYRAIFQAGNAGEPIGEHSVGLAH